MFSIAQKNLGFKANLDENHEITITKELQKTSFRKAGCCGPSDEKAAVAHQHLAGGIAGFVGQKAHGTGDGSLWDRGRFFVPSFS
jgi:hypothetical protein